MTNYDGVVLAGGRARRMGGSDKTAIQVGGRPMLATATAALARANRVVVVGPGGDVIEDPPGGGPLVALAAGLRRVTAPTVVVLAGDLPFVSVAAVETLVAHAPAVAIDDKGRAQYLLAAYLTEQLRGALPADPAGHSLRSVVDCLDVQHVALDGTPPPWWDCDTPDELDQARMWS